jgi:hypothetical protein
METIGTPVGSTGNTDKINADTTQVPSISVFPNPSDNTFTITISNINNYNQPEMKITDVESQPVYLSGSPITCNQFSGSYQFVWNADKVLTFIALK